ncbi:MAG TPA: hypothetical protein VHT03_10595 [Rhizomicrobium sp.]|jgi:hypothetical protein|nr:hypothetical protein [Rhizomicrobium sp.]
MAERQSENREAGPPEHRALATADLAGTEAPDEAWQKSHNGENDGKNGGENDGKNGGPGAHDEERVALLPKADCDRMRGEWDSIQAAFVDEPRRAVERADNLVATTMKTLAETFAAERSRLEGAWDRGDNVSTEDLRLALQRYRSFFHRLLSV